MGFSLGGFNSNPSICGCCEPPCDWSLCAVTSYCGGPGPGTPLGVAGRVQFTDPDDVVHTGVACIESPEPGSWTVGLLPAWTGHPTDPWADLPVTVEVEECHSVTATVKTYPLKITALIQAGGCNGDPIPGSYSFTGPGGVSASGHRDGSELTTEITIDIPDGNPIFADPWDLTGTFTPDSPCLAAEGPITRTVCAEGLIYGFPITAVEGCQCVPCCNAGVPDDLSYSDDAGMADLAYDDGPIAWAEDSFGGWVGGYALTCDDIVTLGLCPGDPYGPNRYRVYSGSLDVRVLARCVSTAGPSSPKQFKVELYMEGRWLSANLFPSLLCPGTESPFCAFEHQPGTWRKVGEGILDVDSCTDTADVVASGTVTAPLAGTITYSPSAAAAPCPSPPCVPGGAAILSS